MRICVHGKSVACRDATLNGCLPTTVTDSEHSRDLAGLDINTGRLVFNQMSKTEAAPALALSLIAFIPHVTDGSIMSGNR